MALFKLIYVSSARQELASFELVNIMESSVDYNLKNSISGMLLYLNGNFMQVLEGDEEAVDETFSRIKADPRHTAITVIVRNNINARYFSRWSMGFKHVQTSDLASNPAYAPILENGFEVKQGRITPGLALELLKTFAETQGR